MLGVVFDTIVACTATTSMHAGMIAGFAGQERPRRVMGMEVSAAHAQARGQLERITRHTADLMALDEFTVLEG